MVSRNGEGPEEYSGICDYFVDWKRKEVFVFQDFRSVKVYDTERRFIREEKAPEQITGYEYEVEAAVRAVREGKTECKEMPHKESIFMMELMDRLRREWGIIYPFD